MSRMVSFRDGWRLFKEGLDRKLIWEYWLAVKSHGWEIFWGAGVIGIICTTVTLYYAPSRWVLGWTVAWVLLVAGYYVWRADHVRLEQKIEVRVRRHSWPIETGGEGIQYYFEIINKSEATTIYRVHAHFEK